MPAAIATEPGSAAPTRAPGPKYDGVQRLRLFAVSLAIALMVFAQNGGSVAADTKLDLIVDPARFLRRALSLWDPIGSAGQLQDQAYGYLFPMGPFFLVGHWLALPPWVIQRSWESAVLIAAFLGLVRLARAFGIAGFWPQVGAGLAYALAPRMLSELFGISSELLPVAVLPWVLLPLVAPVGGPRRAAARSGVALLFAGGINASATLAILPAPLWYLLTRRRGRDRAQLLRWWLLAVLLSSLWWAAPLAVLGKYSPPFLDWIESAAVTTTPTSLAASLRGVDHWLAYLGPTSWPAGWLLLVTPAAVLATGLVAAAGLAGLLRSGRERLFLAGGLVIGLTLLTLGHRSSVGPPFALAWQHLLDGPANAFRNVHKFDPLVRLPLALGIGRLLAWLPTRPLRLPFELGLRPGQLVALLAATVGVVAISPVFGGNMVTQPRPIAEAPWWPQAANWLDAHAGSARALVVPGAGRPNLIWGQTVDDPLQPVARSPWTVRDALPLTQPGYIRYLDAIDAILARGQAAPTLPGLLARAGIGYLVVRNDLDSAAAGAPRLAYVHSTIATTAGLTEVAGFGPDFGGQQGFSDLTDAGAWPASPAVQIYRVAGYAGVVGLQPAARLIRATGSADALPALAERGLGLDQPVLFGPGPAGAGGTTVVTDGIRRREISFGAANENAATMTAGAPFDLARAAHDYLPADPGPLSTFGYSGVAAVTASSSGAQLGALFNRGATSAPFYAVDGDPNTAWRSGSAGAVGQWLQVDFRSGLNPAGARFAFAPGLGDFPTRLRVSTEAGSTDFDVANDSSSQPLPVPTGATRWLRITVLQMAAGGSSVGLSQLSIPGVAAERTLQVPVIGSADVLAFDVADGRRAQCLTVTAGAACSSEFAAAGEEDGALDRSFSLGADRTYHVAATVRLRPSAGLDHALDSLSPLVATASSVQAGDPRVRPGAAVDGDPDTSWTARTGDPEPSLTVTMPSRERLTGLRLLTPAQAPVSRPDLIQVRAGDFSWSGPVPADGRIDFGQPVSAKSLTIVILKAKVRSSVDGVTRATEILPVGIGEVQPLGVRLPAPQPAFSIGCNAGLDLLADGRPLALQASVPASAALTGQPVLATPCGRDAVDLGPGAHRFRLAATTVVAPVSITATADGTAPLGGPAPAGLQVQQLHWGDTSRQVRVSAPVAAYLAVRENGNAGWQASLHGRRLTSVLLDGWQQGYLLPAGSQGVVTLTFTPQRPYLAGLIGGGLAALALLLLAGWPLRRRQAAHRVLAAAPDQAGAIPAGVLSPVLLAGLVLIAGFALLGWPGLVLAAAVLAARSWLPGRWQPWWLPPAVLAAVAGLIALLPPGSTHSASNSGLVQLLCGFALLATAAVATGSRRVLGRPSRSSRRSTPNQDTAATAVADTAVSPNNSRK